MCRHDQHIIDYKCRCKDGVNDMIKLRCVPLNDILIEVDDDFCKAEDLRLLGGSLPFHLMCDDVVIKTPFSEGLVDVSGLNYVTFNTKLNNKQLDSYYKVYLMLSDEAYALLAEKIDLRHVKTKNFN